MPPACAHFKHSASFQLPAAGISGNGTSGRGYRYLTADAQRHVLYAFGTGLAYNTYTASLQKRTYTISAADLMAGTTLTVWMSFPSWSAFVLLNVYDALNRAGFYPSWSPLEPFLESVCGARKSSGVSLEGYILQSPSESAAHC